MGDWHALAVHMKSPTGVGSYKQPLSPLVLPLQEPDPRGRFGFVVGAHPVGDWHGQVVHAIAHRGGLLQTATQAFLELTTAITKAAHWEHWL